MHPLGPALGPVDRLHRVAVARPGGQAVHGVGRHDDDAPAAQHLGRGQGALVVGAHDPHGVRHGRRRPAPVRPAQSFSGRIGGAMSAGSDRQSTPGTST